ncbi:Transient receptor potential cation channel subfamily V member 6, partial [Brachionus plicatilis]
SRLPEFDLIYYSDFIKVVFVVFMILMHILLLNMLIAMMGNTYHQIIKKSEKEWRRQWAQVVILLERSFSPKELQKFQNQYSITLPKKYSSKKEAVGLMVIKKVAKTKAFEKTSCARNWKRFFKSVMTLLKDNKYTAEQLLDVWANKDTKLMKSKKIKKEFNWKNYGISKRVNLTDINLNKALVSESVENMEKKPPLPTRFKFSFDSEKGSERKLKKKDVDESLSKKGKETLSANTPEVSSNSSSISSDKTTESFVLTQPVNKFLSKKTFFPNQTSKIYSNDLDFDSQYTFSKQVNLSPARESSKLDLCDVRRPFSSSLKQNGEASDSKSQTEENMSIDSDNGMSVFKRSNLHDDENSQKESKI